MKRDELYREAARRAVASVTGAGLSIEDVATVQVLNLTGPTSLGDGAFVELKVWIPAAAAAAIDLEGRPA